MPPLSPLVISFENSRVGDEVKGNRAEVEEQPSDGLGPGDGKGVSDGRYANLKRAALPVCVINLLPGRCIEYLHEEVGRADSKSR